jgi:phage-related protein
MWSVETLNSLVDSEIENLPEDMQARLVRFAQIIGNFGLQALPPGATKHLEDKLWELRLTGKSGISRAIYVTTKGKRVVILRAFIKKTQKTPKTELELARLRAKEVT